MPLDGAVAEEQLLADLGVGEPVKGQPGYLRFLRREGITGVFGALADGFARGQEFALRPVGGRMGTHRIERRVGRFQLGTRSDTAVFTSKPLAVDELRARGGRRRETVQAARSPPDTAPRHPVHV